MARPRLAKNKEEIENVPSDQPVQIELEEKIVEIEPKVEAQEEKKEEKQEEKRDSSALEKRIQELELAEKTNKEALESERRRADEAQRRQVEYQGQSVQHQRDAEQAQYDAILNAIEASRVESENAQAIIEAAGANGDYKAQAEAYGRLARAAANIAKLEDGKLAYEARIESAKTEPQGDRFENAISGMPDNVKTWVRARPEYMTDPRKNSKMQAAHWDALDAGKSFGSQGYLDEVEMILGLKERPKKVEQKEEKDDEDTVVMQAPPTRDVASPTTGKPKSSRITLTAMEREMARLSMPDRPAAEAELEYARQKMVMAEHKANGMYRESN